MITLKSINKMKTLFAVAVVMFVAGIALSDTYTVTHTDDSGEGSLRWAIKSANDNPGSDSIEFDIDATGPQIIQPLSALPEITDSVIIDGYTQGDASPATAATPANLQIVLDGSSLGSEHLGLLSLDPGASDCEIRGLVISNYNRNGIFIESGANGNVIEGNYIGTDYTGTAGQPNGECGIFIKSPNNTIGGTTPAARNVISANGDGITIYGSAASGNEVLGNFIGTDASGMSYLPNSGVGVGINDAPDNVVGGTALGSRNVVTSIDISNPEATNNQIVGNYIGINAAGDGLLSGEYTGVCGVLIKVAFHNVVGPDNVISGCTRGVVIWPGASYTFVHDNYIGTDATGQLFIGNEWDGVTINSSHNTIEDNVVSGSSSNGIYVSSYGSGDEMPNQNMIAGNIIGMNVSGDVAVPNTNGVVINMAVNTTVSRNVIAGNLGTGVGVANDLPWTGDDLAIGNRITQNAIYDNGGLGIELVPDGVTPNDPSDTDTGPNNLMNFPVLASAMATQGQLVVTGTIDTPNPMSVKLEFFANSAPDDLTGYGEGEIYLGEARPNATGAFTAVLPAVSPGTWISATATDRDGNTSEFALTIEAAKPGKP
jgi:hypothetical protein